MLKIRQKKKNEETLWLVILGLSFTFFSGVSFLPDTNSDLDVDVDVDVDCLDVVGHIARLGPALELHLSAVNIF